MHRDIKPENILLGKDGRVKIADFGLSRLLGSESTEEVLTGTHQVMGTLRYMAPEQLEGARGVDHRADIYSLGVVFYEMLTGELPLGRFSLPSEKVQIDVRLDDVVLRTLEKEPQRRYQRASEVKSDLESITSGFHQQLEPTIDLDAAQVSPKETSESENLKQQELASRVLLMRRELMSRVAKALRPLFWGQIIQMLFGIAFIALGVYCWAPNQDVPHKLASGIVLHAYGVLMVLAAGVTCARIQGLDYSKPADSVRDQLGKIRNHYLRSGGWLGFSWWLLWIPSAVAIGFDAVVYPPGLVVSLVIGVIGMVASLALYSRSLRSEKPSAERWSRALAGQSLSAAYVALEEIARVETR